jgi:hypothetical protein
MNMRRVSLLLRQRQLRRYTSYTPIHHAVAFIIVCLFALVVVASILDPDIGTSGQLLAILTGMVTIVLRFYFNR